MHMFIECINVDYKSTRRESFMDLQLDVKGCANIYNSFDKYCEVEVMDGQNQYQTDEHGMQVSRLDSLFGSFMQQAVKQHHISCAAAGPLSVDNVINCLSKRLITGLALPCATCMIQECCEGLLKEACWCHRAGCQEGRAF